METEQEWRWPQTAGSRLMRPGAKKMGSGSSARDSGRLATLWTGEEAAGCQPRSRALSIAGLSLSFQHSIRVPSVLLIHVEALNLRGLRASRAQCCLPTSGRPFAPRTWMPGAEPGLPGGPGGVLHGKSSLQRQMGPAFCLAGTWLLCVPLLCLSRPCLSQGTRVESLPVRFWFLSGEESDG